MEGDEGSCALTPSWDRLLTTRELEEGFLGLSPASPPSSAVDGSQLTFEAHVLAQEAPSSKCERKLARAFTFSSESVAKISPVTQSILNPSSAPGTPYHSTPLNDLGVSLDEVWASGALTGVMPINKTLKCVVEKPKLLGTKPKKLPLKPQGTLLTKPSADSTVLKPLNSTFCSAQATLSRKHDCLNCSSPPSTSRTFDKMKETPSEKEQPPLLSHKEEVNILPQVKPTSKGLMVVKEKPPVKKPSSVTATKSVKLLKVPNGKLNTKSPTGPPSTKGAPSLTVSRANRNILAINEKSPSHMLSTTSRPANAPNSSRSSVSSLDSTRNASSKQPKRPAPSDLFNATKVVNSNKVKPANSAKETVQFASKAHSQLKLNMRHGESRTSVRNKNDKTEVQQSKTNFTREMRTGDSLKVGKETRTSTGETAKSSGTRAKIMQPPKPRLLSTSRQPQPRLPSKIGFRGDISRDRPTLNQGASKSEDQGKKELQRLQQSLEAMAVMAKWEGERRESSNLLRCIEVEARQVLEKRLESLRNVERKKEEAEDLVARLATVIESRAIEHEREVAVYEKRVEEEREKAERKVASQEAEMETQHQTELEYHAAEHFAEVAELKKEIWRVTEQLQEEMKEKERLQKNVMNLEAKVAALVVSVMQGVDERREGVIVGLKQEVHSLSMVLEMRSKELREEQEKRVTLEMELEEQTATEKTVHSLRNQIEGLKTQLESKRSSERARELEVAQLQDSLNKESKENRRLSMEREQLEWKVLEATPPAARSLQMREKEEQRSLVKPSLSVRPFISRMKRSTNCGILDHTFTMEELVLPETNM